MMEFIKEAKVEIGMFSLMAIFLAWYFNMAYNYHESDKLVLVKSQWRCEQETNEIRLIASGSTQVPLVKNDCVKYVKKP